MLETSSRPQGNDMATKPPDVKRRDPVELQIRRAEQEGAFENLPGRGRPLRDLAEVYDPFWWAKQLVRREQLSVLPPALEIRRKVERFLAGLPRLRSEQEVRARATELDREIRHLNARVTSGPPSVQAPLDVEAVVARWRAERGLRATSDARAPGPDDPRGHES